MAQTVNTDPVVENVDQSSPLARAREKIAVVQAWWEFVAPKVVGIGGLATGAAEVIHPQFLANFHHPEIMLIGGLMFAGGEKVKEALAPYFTQRPGGR